MSMERQWRHGGDVGRLASRGERSSEELVDFSANINPCGFPSWLREVVNAELSRLRHYSDYACEALKCAAAERYGVLPEQVVAGNGSSELLFALPRALGNAEGVIAEPCYSEYEAALERQGVMLHRLQLCPENDFALDMAKLDECLKALPAPATVILGHPNNPTGRSLCGDELRALAARHARHSFVIDEAFGDFVEDFDSLTRNRPANVIVLLSLTKNYAIPGLRLGLAVADAEIAQRLEKELPPWTVNTLAQAVGERALSDRAYIEESRRMVRELRAALVERLGRIPSLRVFAGEADFVLFRVEHPLVSACELIEKLLRRGIAVRDCSNFHGMPEGYVRVAVRMSEENERLCEALECELVGAPAVQRHRKTPALMMQGTSSNAGKSVLTAGLCRILLQDGFDVAPFKAQNMSLNSHVTRDGGEIGRAQALQAQACWLEADTRMNPVLLKPNSQTGSQVLVLGRPVATMQATEYYRKKRELVDVVHRAYDELAAEHDVMVLEGAGSPAEVNLKAHDIVNMSMAMYAKAPVLLVGDIDRGGVFASFIGCMSTFDERERAQIAGFVVNRFRGDASLLTPALEYVERCTGQPVFGVVPNFNDLGLPEEDSVSFKQSRAELPTAGKLDVALIDLPHISNFTDCDALAQEPDVALRVVRQSSELGSPNAVILPGSRNVPGDLATLRRGGMTAALLELAARGGCEIVGLCGGFQMLGVSIDDPHGLESSGETVPGFGLLPVRTTLALEKTLRRNRGRDIACGCRVQGYEIHHGRTELGSAQPVYRDDSGETQGACSKDGLIWGTYLHGIFDSDEFRRAFLDRLRRRAGLKPIGEVVAPYDLEPALDRLAERLRQALPIEQLYRVMGLR